MTESSRSNGCSSDTCNVLQIVEMQIKGIVESQIVNVESLRTLIIEKFDNMEKNNTRESARINELRSGDIEAVRIANDSTVKRAELLSQQLVETAETVRKTTDTLATNLATQFQQITTRQDEKIAALERVNWENSGKAGASPDLQKMVTDLVNTKYEAKGRAGAFNPILGLLYTAAGGVLTYILLQIVK